MFSVLQEIYSFLATPGIAVANLVFANDDLVWASWRFMAEVEIPSLRHTDEVVGAYVTAGVRLHLYSNLDGLKERAIYCDTDIVVFVQPRNEPALADSGDNFEAMTSELRPFEFIEEIVCGGSKFMPTRKFIQGQACERRSVKSEG